MGRIGHCLIEIPGDVVRIIIPGNDVHVRGEFPVPQQGRDMLIPVARSVQMNGLTTGDFGPVTTIILALEPDSPQLDQRG